MSEKERKREIGIGRERVRHENERGKMRES